jgi:hypothetical protein
MESEELVISYVAGVPRNDPKINMPLLRQRGKHELAARRKALPAPEMALGEPQAL